MSLEREPRPHLVATLPIWASLELTSNEKIVWYHTWLLDTTPTDGCYISARSMGERLGLSPKTVEEIRSRLVGMRLLGSFPRPGTVQPGWFARVPPSLLPSSKDLQKVVREIQLLRDKLDERVRGYHAEQARRRTEPPPDIDRKGAPRGDGGKFRRRAEDASADARSARGGEGVGGGATPISSETIERSLPSAVTEPQRQMRVGSHEPERQMRGPKAPDLETAKAEWAAVFKLQRGEKLTPEEQRHAANYASRHSTERRGTGT